MQKTRTKKSCERKVSVLKRNIFDECNFCCILNALIYFDVLISDFLDDHGDHDVRNGTVSSNIGFILGFIKLNQYIQSPKLRIVF
jgi:hypothetical protein